MIKCCLACYCVTLGFRRGEGLTALDTNQQQTTTRIIYVLKVFVLKCSERRRASITEHVQNIDGGHMLFTVTVVICHRRPC